jgi:hypothetical protein
MRPAARADLQRLAQAREKAASSGDASEAA